MQPDRRLAYGDLRDLKELLGSTFLDFSWLMAFHLGTNWFSSKPEQARRTIEDPVLCGLTRLVLLLATNDPDFRVLPRMPTPQEVFDRLREPYERVTGRELLPSRFATLCLVTPATVGDWLKDRPVSIRSQRHLFLLDWFINRGGEKALREYLRLLEIEAKARGFGSLEDVFRARSWSAKRAVRQQEPPPTKRKRARGRPTSNNRIR
jgi:hypothetical protein